MNSTTTSYNNIRQTIGALGIALPALIYLHTGIIGGCWYLQDSISHYFYTTGTVFFEGVLWILGLVLIYYPAFKDEKRGDVILTTLSGFFAWGVALIPTNNNSSDSCSILKFPPDSALRNDIHLACAALMLLIFSYMSIKLFTRSNPAHYGAHNPDRWKKIRNGIYITCGVITALSIITIGVLSFFDNGSNIPFKYTFWFEVTSIVPFGIAWLIKGGFLFTDQGEASTMEQAMNLLLKPKKNK